MINLSDNPDRFSIEPEQWMFRPAWHQQEYGFIEYPLCCSLLAIEENAACLQLLATTGQIIGAKMRTINAMWYTPRTRGAKRSDAIIVMHVLRDSEDRIELLYSPIPQDQP